MKPFALLSCAITVMAAACGAPPSANESPRPAGGQATAQATAPPPAQDFAAKGACALLTNDEAERLLKGPLKRARQSGPGRSPQGWMVSHTCFYSNPNGRIELAVNRYNDAVLARQQYDAIRKPYSGTDVHEVSGVGEAAFWVREQLIVRRGDVHLMLKVDFEDDRELKHYGDKPGIDALIELERTLALEALKRLPAAATGS